LKNLLNRYGVDHGATFRSTTAGISPGMTRVATQIQFTSHHNMLLAIGAAPVMVRGAEYGDYRCANRRSNVHGTCIVPKINIASLK
jgi:hypothetical protein